MKKILISVMTLVLVLGLVGAGAFALFTDTKDVGQNVFATGTVDLTVGSNSPLPFTISNMAPGDSVTGTITVANAGTLDLRYAMTTTVGGANPGLAGQLEVEIMIYKAGPILYTGLLRDAVFDNRDLSGSGTPGFSEFNVLQFVVTLPLVTGDTWQGTSCDVTFVFHAEQTANN